MHDKLKHICRLCTPAFICQHHIYKDGRVTCNPGVKCMHNKFKRQCAGCDGFAICKSRKEPYSTVFRQRGNRKYCGFCTHCFANIFPGNPKTESIRKKSKELRIVSYISGKYDGFIHDKLFYADLENGCCSTKRRIDLRHSINDTMRCIESDEHQHNRYING